MRWKIEQIIRFKDRLFTIRYQPETKKSIPNTSNKYKPRIKGKVQEYIHRGKHFNLVYKFQLVKYNIDREEETQDVYLHSGNRRKIYMEQFDEVYYEAMDEINQKLADYIGESAVWVMDRIRSIDVN